MVEHVYAALLQDNAKRWSAGVSKDIRQSSKSSVKPPRENDLKTDSIYSLSPFRLLGSVIMHEFRGKNEIRIYIE